MSVSTVFLIETVEETIRYLQAKDASKGRVLARKLEKYLELYKRERKRSE